MFGGFYILKLPALATRKVPLRAARRAKRTARLKYCDPIAGFSPAKPAVGEGPLSKKAIFSLLPLRLHKYRNMTSIINYSILTGLFLFLFIPAATTQQKNMEQQVMEEQLFIDAKKAQLLEKKEEAIRLYSQLLDKNEKNAAANYEVALLYRSLNQLDKAAIYAEKATTLSKESPQENLYLQLYLSIVEIGGNYQVLVDYYANAAQKMPNDISNYYEWAHYLVKNNDLNKAVKVYEKVAKKTLLTEFIALKQVDLYKRMDKFNKAEKILLALEKTAPKNPAFKLHLARFYKETKKTKKVDAYYKAVLVLDPNNSQANIALVSSFLEEKDTTKYLNALEPIFEDKTYQLEEKLKTFTPLVAQSINQSNWVHSAQIQRLGKKLKATAPKHPEVNYLFGELLYTEGAFYDALACYKISLKSYPKKAPLLLRELDCLFELRKQQLLIKKTLVFTGLYPNQLKGMLYTAFCLHLQGNYRNSNAELEAIEDILPANQQHLKGRIFHIQALNAAAQSQPDIAKKHFKEANLYLFEDIQLLYDFACFLYKEQVDLNKALELTKQALSLDPQQLFLLEIQVKILYRQQAYKKLIYNLEDRIEGIQNAVIVETYGNALFKTGDEIKAVDTWKRARTLDGHSSFLLKKIQTRKLYE